MGDANKRWLVFGLHGFTCKLRGPHQGSFWNMNQRHGPSVSWRRRVRQVAFELRSADCGGLNLDIGRTNETQLPPSFRLADSRN